MTNETGIIERLPTADPTLDAQQLAELADRIVKHARMRGASAAECVIREGRELSVNVRLGEVESLKEAGGKSLGIRVFLGHRAASTYTSDFSWGAIEGMVDAALAIARVTSEDPYAGMPEADQIGQLRQDLQIYQPGVADISAETGIELARRCERAALDTDSRINNSEGGSFYASEGRKILANSLGFIGEYRRSYCSISAVPVAAQNGQMQRDYWYSAAHSLAQLETPEAVGRKAAERTLRRLGARKQSSARVPVVFDPMVSRSIVDHVFQAVTGDAIYREASFLHGRLGQQIANSGVTVIDDGTMPAGFGSRPFDAEAVPTRRTLVIDRGILKSFLLNTYTARKLDLVTTGNASRALAGNPSVGAGNLYLERGSTTAEEIIRNIKRGLYVTEFIGSGLNIVTGDYSRGAVGLWIEDGQFAYPVEEITVAGNLKDMLQNIAAIGSDLEFRAAIAAPTLVIEGMTVGGA